MATETQIRIRRNPYSGYEVWIYGNGELTRRSFDNSIDLAAKLAADCFDDRTIEQACDLLDVYEWGGEPEYPLGVSYRPVAEACCDEPVYQGFISTLEPDRGWPDFWDLAAASLRIGAVASPWVLLIVAAKWAGVL